MSKSGILLGVGGVIVLAVAAGSGGYFVGRLSERVAHLERQQDASAAPQMTAQYQAMPALPAPQAVPSMPVVQPPAIDADGVPTAIAGVLGQKESASRILDVLAKASAIATPGESAQDQPPIYAFFDPRCPYCKKAMAELNGKAAVHWIPVSLLGDMETGSGMIEAMKAIAPADAVSQVAAGALHPKTGEQATKDQLNENASILFALYEGAQDAVAVPTILVPRKDGTVQFVRGFDPGDGAKIMSAYGG